MKRLFRLSFMLVLSAILQSCDPSGITTIYVENATQSPIIFHAFLRTTLNDGFDELTSKEVTIPPSSRMMVGKAWAWADAGIDCAAHLFCYYVDSVQITIGEQRITYYNDSIISQKHSPYTAASFNEENYRVGAGYCRYADAIYTTTEEQVKDGTNNNKK